MITDQLVDSLMFARREIASLGRVLEITSEQAEYSRQRKKVKEAKSTMLSEYQSICNKILKKIPDGINYVHLASEWYGIRYRSEGGTAKLLVVQIDEADIVLLERDGKTLRDLNEAEVKEIEANVSTSQDRFPALSSVELRVKELLQEYGFVEPLPPASVLVADSLLDDVVPTPTNEGDEVQDPIEPTVGDGVPATSFRVSTHTGIRYVQRVLGIGAGDDSKATKKYMQDRTHIDASIASMFHAAERIWVEETTGVEYYLDANNYVFVVGYEPDKTLITMYEEDFGWDKAKNRWLILEQLKDLAVIRENIEKLDLKVSAEGEANKVHYEAIDLEIASLQGAIEALQARRAAIQADETYRERALSSERQLFAREFKKLFSDRGVRQVRV